MNGTPRTNWRTTIGGAFAAAGAALTGGTLIVSVGGVELPKPVIMWLLLIGVIFNVLGIFFGHLFAADAKALQTVKEQVQENTVAIASGDTKTFQKPTSPWASDASKPAEKAP